MRIIETSGIAERVRAERLAKHPHQVEQHGLMWHALGDDRFRAELDERRRWIEQHRSASFAFGTLPDGAGRVYFFADPDDAFHFKVRFGSRVFPPGKDR